LKAKVVVDLSSTSASASFAIAAIEAASRGSTWLSIFWKEEGFIAKPS
jgi:hypothetical protein